MIIDEKLYVYNLTDRDKRKAVRALKKYKSIDKIKRSSLWVVTLPIISDGLLEVCNVKDFKQKFYESIEDSIHVVGITFSEEDATELIRMIVDEVYKNTKGFDMKAYFSTGKN